MAKHSAKISVDLRGFHIFDDGDDSSSDNEGDQAKKKTLKSKIKHAKKMSVDLSGYHIFGDEEPEYESDEDEKKEALAKPRVKHSKKVSIDLQGFDLFYDSDDQDNSDNDDEDDEEFQPRAPEEFSPSKDTISKKAEENFKKAQKMYLNDDEDNDLKGFHLFDEYNSEDEDEDEAVIKLHEMEKDQLAVLVRSLLVENAILKDASHRARGKLDNKKQKLQDLEESKKVLLREVSKEMEHMRHIIYDLLADRS